MKVDVVVDVGNSRVKWGRCSADAVEEMIALAHDPGAWQAQWQRWNLGAGLNWVLSGVKPTTRDALSDWLHEKQQQVHLLNSYHQVPIPVLVDYPEQVGIDRLLNAVAANSRRPSNQSAVVIDAGSAVTLNFIDAAGAYRGGAIFPGMRLMAKALHQYTALLPLVEVAAAPASLPAVNTRTSIEAGVFWAVAGGIRALLERLPEPPASIFLAGGDGPLLADALGPKFIPWPAITLEGIRLAALPWP